MEENNKKAVKIIFVIVLVMAAVFALFVIIGDICGLKMANDLMAYIKENIGAVSLTTVLGVAVAMFKTVSSLTSKNGENAAKIDEMKKAAKESAEELKQSQEALKTATDMLKEQPKLLEEMTKRLGNLDTKNTTTVDLLLAYVLKGNNTEAVRQLRESFAESELLKNVRALQEIESLPESELGL